MKEKSELKFNFQKFILGTVVLGVFSTTITGIIQWKQLIPNQKDVEQKNLSQFVDAAIEKKLIEGSRFAEHFEISADSPFSQEDSTLALEKYKLKLDFQKFILGTVVLGVFSTAVTSIIQWKELMFNQREIEQKHLSQFVDAAMEKKLIERIRFAEYFATLADFPSQNRWQAYLKTLQDEKIYKENRLKKVVELIRIQNDRSNPVMVNRLTLEKEQLEDYLGIIAETFDADVESWFTDEKLDSNIIDGSRFVWRDALTRKSGIAVPASDLCIQNIERMALELQKIEDIIGSPITIVRWYSPPLTNRSVGGVSRNSLTTGEGVIFSVSGYTGVELSAKLDAEWNYGMGTFKDQPDLLKLDIKAGKRRYQE